MTTTILVVAAVAAVATVALEPKDHTPPPEPSAAVAGADGHYTYHRGWHRGSEQLPMGQRAGAESYPRTSPAHWEIPQPSSAAFQGDPMMSEYKQMHEHGESGTLKSSRYAYTGAYPLPPGTWTGEPLAAPQTWRTSTWRQDVNGTYRKDEVSGKVLTVNTMSTAPAGKTPAPTNP